MGITVDSLSVAGGRATVPNVYAHIRDINYTKLEDGTYEYTCTLHYSGILSQTFSFSTTTLPTDTVWGMCYTAVKAKLSEAGITFVDTM